MATFFQIDSNHVGGTRTKQNKSMGRRNILDWGWCIQSIPIVSTRLAIRFKHNIRILSTYLNYLLLKRYKLALYNQTVKQRFLCFIIPVVWFYRCFEPTRYPFCLPVTLGSIQNPPGHLDDLWWFACDLNDLNEELPVWSSHFVLPQNWTAIGT